MTINVPAPDFFFLLYRKTQHEFVHYCPQQAPNAIAVCDTVQKFIGVLFTECYF